MFLPLQCQAKAASSASSDPVVKQLSIIVEKLCVEIGRIEKTANEAMAEARRAKRATSL